MLAAIIIIIDRICICFLLVLPTITTVELQLFHVALRSSIRFPGPSRRRCGRRREGTLHGSRRPHAGAALLPAAAALLLVLLLPPGMRARFQPLLGVGEQCPELLLGVVGLRCLGGRLLGGHAVRLGGGGSGVDGFIFGLLGLGLGRRSSIAAVVIVGCIGRGVLGLFWHIILCRFCVVCLFLLVVVVAVVVLLLFLLLLGLGFLLGGAVSLRFAVGQPFFGEGQQRMQVGVGIAVGDAVRHRRGRFVAAGHLAIVVVAAVAAIVVLAAAVIIVPGVIDVLGVSTHMLVSRGGSHASVVGGRLVVVLVGFAWTGDDAIGYWPLGGGHLVVVRCCCCRYRGAIRAARNRHDWFRTIEITARNSKQEQTGWSNESIIPASIPGQNPLEKSAAYFDS